MSGASHAQWALLVWLSACGAESGEGDRHEHAHDGGADHADAAEFVGCPDTIPPFALGLRTASADGSIQAALRAASSVPPVRFLNDWTVEFTDALGQPLAGVELREVRAFMPVHGHYGKPDARLRRHQDAPAVFDLDAINLFMRGPWEVQLALSTPSMGPVELVFEVCVEE